MAWLAVTLEVDAQRAEVLGDALLARGALSVDVTDADEGTPLERARYHEPDLGRGTSEFPGVLQDAPGPARWARARMAALFDAAADITACVSAALSAAGLDAAQAFDLKHVEDRDWVRATQNQFPPLQISARLWVVPSWHTAPDPGAVNLIIDPGLAFGTGTHATTRLCLEWLADHVRGGETVLDYGCGSGILAIAALKLGATAARGVDIDENALLAARQNALQNQVDIRFETPAVGVPPATADIVLANILANPLVILAPLLARTTRRGGSIVLSGVLDTQTSEVGDTYQAWFDMGPPRRREGWSLLCGTRRAD